MTASALALTVAFAVGSGWRLAAQPIEIPPDATIQLQRTQCYGSCPVYSITIDARGTVTYEGERFVRVVGRQTARVPRSSVADLLATAHRIQFFYLRDAYRGVEMPSGSVATASDLPTKIVTITANGRTKRVQDDLGAPDNLASFERQIDDAAGTKRWVFVDDESLGDLVRSGWSASGEEGAALLQEAVGRDDVSIARQLIELGAHLDGPKTNCLPLLV